MRFEYSDSATSATWTFDPGSQRWTVTAGDFRRSSANLLTLEEIMRKRSSNPPSENPPPAKSEEVVVGMAQVRLPHTDWLADLPVFLQVRETEMKIGWDAKTSQPQLTKTRQRGGGWTKAPSFGNCVVLHEDVRAEDTEFLERAACAWAAGQKWRQFERSIRERWFRHQEFASQEMAGWPGQGGGTDVRPFPPPTANLKTIGRAAVSERPLFRVPVPPTVPVILVDAQAPSEGWEQSDASSWCKKGVTLALVKWHNAFVFEVTTGPLDDHDGPPQRVFKGKFEDARLFAEATVQVRERALKPVDHWAVESASGSRTPADDFQADRRQDWAALIITGKRGAVDVHLLGRRLHRPHKASAIAFGLETEDPEGFVHWRAELNDRAFRLAGPADRLLDDLKHIRSDLVEELKKLPSTSDVSRRLEELSVRSVSRVYHAAGDGEPPVSDPSPAVIRWSHWAALLRERGARSPFVEDWEARFQKELEHANERLKEAAGVVPSVERRALPRSRP